MKRALAGLGFSVMVASLVMAVPSAANADLGFGFGSLAISPTSGNVNTDVVFLTEIGTNVGAPVGFRASGATYVFQGGVSKGPISANRTPNTPVSFGTFGLDGNPALADRVSSAANPFVSDKLLNALASPLASGPFELRNYWFASATVPNFDDAYVNLPMTYDAATGAWSVLPPPVDTAGIWAGPRL